MTGIPIPLEFDHEAFDFETLDEELQVDQRCRALLNGFYQYLQGIGYTPQAASDLAYSADYYLRDYVVDFLRANVLRPEPGIVRRFAASWHITSTVDPEIDPLLRHLEGVRELYRFLARQGLVPEDLLPVLEQETLEADYYRQRIDAFLAIEGDGYAAWQAELPARLIKETADGM